MRLFKLDNIVINPGAPLLKIYSSDNRLYLVFYSDFNSIDEKTKMITPIITSKIAIIRFNRVLEYKYGLPNDELIFCHQLYKYGLESYSGFCLKDSPWIASTKELLSNHPYFSLSSIKDSKHFILSFKEGVFECIANRYDVKYVNGDMFDVSIKLIQNIFSDEMEL